MHDKSRRPEYGKIPYCKVHHLTQKMQFPTIFYYFCTEFYEPRSKGRNSEGILCLMDVLMYN